MKLVEAADEPIPACPSPCTWTTATDFEICKSCIDGGFTSVMIDGSHFPFEENMALTRKVVEYAHDHGVTVEGELGRLAGIEDAVNVSAEDASYTDPAQVRGIRRATPAWTRLAIAIGTSHGALQVQARPEAAAPL